jgi:hypothetical protein
MRRCVAIGMAVAAGALGAAVAAPSPGAPAAAADQPELVVHVGDRLKVEGEPLGCRIARQDGAVVVDCRRGGSLAGTYGTMLDSRHARVVRFKSDTVAKVVFTATHGGRARRCR